MSFEEFKFLQDITLEAGRRIMEVYNKSSYSISKKADNSPVTDADFVSHRFIVSELKKNSSFPVLSEEEPIAFEERRNWEYFWLVDPLDGTKDFINRTGSFTVNIALIHKNEPVSGIIGVPVTGELYFAAKGGGAFKKAGDITFAIRTARDSSDLKCVESLFHSSEAVEEFKKVNGITGSIKAGSALKFCAVAEGSADVYPRFSPTSEWDTAPGQLLVEEAGGRMISAVDQRRLTYNKESLLNPSFVAMSSNFPLKAMVSE